MRHSLFTGLIAAAALAAGPGFAQDAHSAHHPDAAAEAKPSAMDSMDPAAMHEMCKSVMSKKMDAKPAHEHSREKSGMAMWPNGKPLSKTEMAAMHTKCSAMMADQHAAEAKPPAK